MAVPLLAQSISRPGLACHSIAAWPVTYGKLALRPGKQWTNMEAVRISSPDAASRQIDVAIALLYSGEDAVAAHTLAGAAADIVARCRATSGPDEARPIEPRDACGLSGTDFAEVIQATAEIVRELPQTPYSIEQFALADTCALLVSTIIGVGQLRGKLTISQAVFAFWYLACRLSALGPTFEHKKSIRSIFGNLSRKSVSYRLAVGRRVLLEEMQRIAPVPTGRRTRR